MNEIHLPKTKVAELHAICAERNNDPGELINILHAAQGLFGYLPPEVQQVIAAELNIPVSRVYGVVTFYSFFTMTPKGKYPISVCLGTACYVRGAENVLERAVGNLGLFNDLRQRRPPVALFQKEPGRSRQDPALRVLAVVSACDKSSLQYYLVCTSIVSEIQPIVNGFSR